MVQTITSGHSDLWELGTRAVRELETERGILASSKSEIYGCVFGRDSLITSLALLRVYKKTHDTYYLDLVRKILENLAALQGREIDIETGEEPGKCIHEYRPQNHEHLTQRTERPWRVNAENEMRNYDTVDATPLFLMAVHEYWRVSKDEAFIKKLLPNIHAALDWMAQFGDSNGDGLIDYTFHPDRVGGGLVTQSWMDSTESVFFEDSDDRPQYPIAPVEVQAYAYVALRAWSDYFLIRSPILSVDLARRAENLKKKFNESFVLSGRAGSASLAFAVDGTGRALVSPRSSMAHCLWAVWRGSPGAMPESVLSEEYVPLIARRVLKPDLYVPRAGVRTLSQRSTRYDPASYHNGSIWPHDTAIVAEGLDNFGFREEARRMRLGLVSAYTHFQTPVELFVYSRGRYREYVGSEGQNGCRVQAWSAASLLVVLREDINS